MNLFAPLGVDGCQGYPAAWSGRGAADSAFRYTLWRTWGGRMLSDGYLQVIGLNPSTATEEVDDPTIRRCIGFARRWGYAGLCMTNLYAFRATDPKVMKAQVDPFGPDNQTWLVNIATARHCRRVLAAWGTHGSFLGAADRTANRLANSDVPLYCLGTNADGSPKHPLYVAAATEVRPWP